MRLGRPPPGRLDRAMPRPSLEPDQAAKLVERLANKCGMPIPSRQILVIVKARTPDYTLPLAARSKVQGRGEYARSLAQQRGDDLDGAAGAQRMAEERLRRADRQFRTEDPQEHLRFDNV